MIYYFLISVFVLGMFVGNIAEGKKKPTMVECLILFLLGIFWPFTAFIYAKDWLESRK